MRTVAATVGALLVVVPVVVAAALVATGRATDVGGLVLLAMLCAGGVHTFLSLRRTAGHASSTAPGAQRRWPVAALVAATVAALAVGTLALALLMTALDDVLAGNAVAAEVVVGLVVVVAVTLMAFAGRALR